MKLPQRLKRLESSDVLSIKDSNGDFLVVTKQETANVIREFIRNEVINISDGFSENQKKEINKRIDENFRTIEKSVDSFIEHRFNLLAEKVCDMLITRKFTEEVAKKVDSLLNKKQRGKF